MTIFKQFHAKAHRAAYDITIWQSPDTQLLYADLINHRTGLLAKIGPYSSPSPEKGHEHEEALVAALDRIVAEAGHVSVVIPVASLV